MYETESSVTAKRLRQILIICATAAVVGLIVHVLPLPVALRTSVVAVVTGSVVSVWCRGCHRCDGTSSAQA